MNTLFDGMLLVPVDACVKRASVLLFNKMKFVVGAFCRRETEDSLIINLFVITTFFTEPRTLNVLNVFLPVDVNLFAVTPGIDRFPVVV